LEKESSGRKIPLNLKVWPRAKARSVSWLHFSVVEAKEDQSSRSRFATCAAY
jgi:hypothetical protein